MKERERESGDEGEKDTLYKCSIHRVKSIGQCNFKVIRALHETVPYICNIFIRSFLTIMRWFGFYCEMIRQPGDRLIFDGSTKLSQESFMSVFTFEHSKNQLND